MLSFLIVYGTSEGQTAKIAERMAEAFDRRGHEATALDADAVPADLEVGDFDAVLVGASIHMGAQSPEVGEFVRNHREPLSVRPTGFFQVSMASAYDDEQHRAQAASYVDSFLETVGWNPGKIAMFGGALRYSKYGFLKRLMMKSIARSAGGDTDTSRDHEYTDWQQVDRFAADFASFVEQRVGRQPPGNSRADG